ncbi:hypothetical protein D1AOALGA4SA_10382 [Olavius algarvensis Delta 1 endosymbiont]|nr:hypothetical protein D1AOALGA4SA_10382 [Olavius algarvensis Delta 1 endosymbiont]
MSGFGCQGDEVRNPVTPYKAISVAGLDQQCSGGVYPRLNGG